MTNALFYGPLTMPTYSNGDPRPANPSDVDASFENLRYGVSSAGDQNQDGYEDILVGGVCANCNGDNYYNIYMFYGAPN